MANIPFPFKRRPEDDVRIPRVGGGGQFITETPEEAQARVHSAAMGSEIAFPATINYDGFNPQPTNEEPVAAPGKPAIDPSVLPPSTGPAANWRMNRAPDVEAAPTKATTPLPATETPGTTTEPVAAAPMMAPESPWTVHYKGGRPADVTTTGDPAEARAALAKAVDDYIPPKDSWKKRLLKAGIGVGSIFASAAGRDPEGAQRAGYMLGRNLANPRLAGQQWQQQRKAQMAGEQEQDLERRKTEAQITSLNADAAKKSQPASPHAGIVKTDIDGYLIVIDPITRKKSDVVDAQGNRVKEKQTSGPVHREVHIDEADGKAWVYENGKRTDLRAPEADRVIVPGYGPMTPSELATRDAVVDRENRGTERGNEAAAQENARIQANINAATTERDSISFEGIPETLKKRVWDGSQYVEQETRNPVYDDRMTRYRQLDDQIRRDSASLKPIVKPNAPTTSKAKPTLNIEGAVERFKVKHKRAPTKEETDKMQAAIDATRK